MKTYDDIGIQIPRFYLPKKSTNLTRWAVIACDQFTSQSEYWQRVEKEVGESPSTLCLILPEVYLDEPGKEERIRCIQDTMRKYLNEGILEPVEGLVYLERTLRDGRKRKGLMLCLDLERYDYARDSTSLIRATEGTILERLPPRMKIRQGAALELPHILVLIDDPGCTVIEPLGARKEKLKELYNFDLMLDSGHLSGYLVNDPDQVEGVARSLRLLAQPEAFRRKYGVGADRPVLLFAIGDGNHSLATAKAVWEKIKSEVGPDHPARYALVEIENVHDEGLEFEPIHRVLFGLKKEVLADLRRFYAGSSYTPAGSAAEMVEAVDKAQGPDHLIGMVGGGEGRTFGLLRIRKPATNLPVGSLQAFLDPFLKEGGADRIDYVHGEDVVVKLGGQPGNVGFYVPGMHKSDLFKTVLLDGVLPRKTFSMGEAREKRFYMESRKIV